MKKTAFTLSLIFITCFINSQTYNCKKILMVVTNSDHDLPSPEFHDMGCYFPEVADFYSKMHEYGFGLEDIDIVSPNGGNAPIFESLPALNISSEEEAELRNKLQHTFKPGQINPADYHIAYYAGGISCLVDFPTAAGIGSLSAQIYEAGGIVAAVCDGIAGLVPIKLSNGEFLVKNIHLTTNHYVMAWDGIDVAALLANKGAIVDQTKLILSDNRVITGQGIRPIEVAEEIMAILTSCETVNIIKNTQYINIRCYPNPASDYITVEYNSNILASLVVLNITGEVVKAAVLKDNPVIRISTDDLAAGVYTLKVTTSNGIYLKKITVQ